MTRHLTIYITMCSLLTLLPLFTGCTNDDDHQTAVGETAIAFDATMAQPTATRANNDINDNAKLSLKSGFGVFGCYTGLHYYSDSNVHPDFMYNEHVTSSDNGLTWQYSPLKYWPNGEGEATGITGDIPHYVSFFAYAPWSDNISTSPDTNPAGYCIPSFSNQGELGNPWLTYRLHPDIAYQIDLLYASNTQEHPIVDQRKPETDQKVNFCFEHALACVGDKISIICSDAIKSQIDNRVRTSTITNAMVVITGIKIEYTLTSKARLVLWNSGEANWQSIFSEDPVCTRTVTILDPNDPADDANNMPVYAYNTSIPSAITQKNDWTGYGVYYIPIELTGYPQTAKVSITHSIATYSGSSWKYDAEKTGTATVNLRDYADAYKAGKHLYINVTLNQVDIAVTAAIAPWIVITHEVEGEED